MNELIKVFIDTISLPEVQTILSAIGAFNSFCDFLEKISDRNNTLGKEAVYCYIESYRLFCDKKGIDFRYDMEKLVEDLVKQYNIVAMDIEVFNRKILESLCGEDLLVDDYDLWRGMIACTIANNHLTMLNTFLMQRFIMMTPSNSVYPRFLTELAPRPPREMKFVGRENECTRILEIIAQEKKLVLVNGLGGVGKSTVCKELFYYLREKTNIGLAWVNYNGESLEGDFIKQFYYPETLTERENRIKYILETEIDEDTIIFVDNLNIRESEDPFIDVLQRANCCVVCTSRVTDYNYFTKVPVDFFEISKCIKLFKSYAGMSLDDTSHDEAIKEIVMRVGRHTLTIEILAKITLAERLLPNELVIKLREQGINVDGIVDVELKEDTLVGHLSRIFPISNLNEEEKYVLAHFANCPLEQIPKNIIKWLGLQSYRSVNVLMRYGWFVENEKSFYMHPIIKEVVKKVCMLKLEDYDMLIYNLDIMSCYDRNLGVEHILPYYQYIKFVIEENVNKNDKSLAHLCFNLGVVDEQTKNYKSAIELFQKAIKMWLTIKSECKDKNEIVYLNTKLANVYVQIGACYYYMGLEVASRGGKKVTKWNQGLNDKDFEGNDRGIDSLDAFSEIEKCEMSYSVLYGLARKWYDKTNELQGEYDDVELEKQLPNNYALTYKYEYEADPENASQHILYKSLDLFYSTVVGFQRLHKVDEFMAVAYRNIGDLYYGLGKYEIAIFYYNKALVISVEQANSYLPNLGKNYMQLGDAFMKLAIPNEFKNSVTRLVKLKVAFGYYKKAHLIVNDNYRKGVNIVDLRGLEGKMLDCETEISELRELLLTEL